MDALKKMNIIEGLFCIGLAIFIIYVTLTQFTIDEFSMGGSFASHSFYPQLIAGVMIFLSILLIITSLLKKKDEHTPVSKAKKEIAGKQDQADGDQPQTKKNSSQMMLFGIAFLLVLYPICLELFGYILVTPFFMIIMFWMLKIGRWWKIILLSIVSSGAIYFFFAIILEVIFPLGRYPLIGQ